MGPVPSEYVIRAQKTPLLGFSEPRFIPQSSLCFTRFGPAPIVQQKASVGTRTALTQDVPMPFGAVVAPGRH